MYEVHSNSTGRTYIYRKPEDTFDGVYMITDDEWEAIEASSWAELATVGEVYEGDAFEIRVTEE